MKLTIQKYMYLLKLFVIHQIIFVAKLQWILRRHVFPELSWSAAMAAGSCLCSCSPPKPAGPGWWWCSAVDPVAGWSTLHRARTPLKEPSKGPSVGRRGLQQQGEAVPHLLPNSTLLPLQFLVSNKVVFKEVELVLQGADRIKKINNKLLLACTEKRMGYKEVYMRTTIMILLYCLGWWNVITKSFIAKETRLLRTLNIFRQRSLSQGFWNNCRSTNIYQNWTSPTIILFFFQLCNSNFYSPTSICGLQCKLYTSFHKIEFIYSFSLKMQQHMPIFTLNSLKWCKHNVILVASGAVEVLWHRLFQLHVDDIADLQISKVQ